MLPLTLLILPYSIQQQTGIDLNPSLHVLIRIQDQDSVSFFGVEIYITDHPMCGPLGPQFRLAFPFEKNCMNALSFLVHYVKKKNIFLNSVQVH